ncbi:hypothetical protein D1839_10220 [Roseburia sp. 1XD42-34]|nr:hypothetical protein [Roseburia sp. 1XD42-34]RKI77910.1 hypothetical protein D7V87_10210 [Clostridium sp. 1xD42-85]
METLKLMKKSVGELLYLGSRYSSNASCIRIPIRKTFMGIINAVSLLVWKLYFWSNSQVLTPQA